MVRISIQAAHEQVNPTDLLNDVVVMDKYGIERCWTSDHYMPWWNSGASGGAPWPWMGAALAENPENFDRNWCNCSYSTLSPSSRGSGIC